ncbi:two-component system response regulator [Streptomyces sp. NPDC090052]|uniref:response regulator n=1 Tax=unclassified Streptomyces TaxID=2593676 RepID=UPI002E206073|nr:response regulator [Streptomyces sp. NBC_00932]
MSATADDSCILIVDDMEENLVALQAVLGPLGQPLVLARSGEEALKAMLRQEFAVVLLDVLMPGMDGFETAANIKRLDQTKDVPIILLTGAEADSDYAYRGYSVGIADFLIKPFDPWLLRTKVSVFLDLHRQKRQISAQAEQLRRLLVTESHSTAHAQPGGSVEPADRMRDKQQRRTTGAGPALARGEELAEIAEQLTQIELLLRDAESPEPGRLADRIADLEHAVGSLLATGDAS